MGLRDELMIPFRGIGDAGHALRAGSAVICKCAGRGLRKGVRAGWRVSWAGDSAADRAENLAVAVFAGAVGLIVVAMVGGVVVYLATPYAVAIACTTAAIWTVAAWTVAPARPKHDAPARPEGPLADTPGGRRIAFLRWLEKTTRGTSGIHLDQMHRQLTQQEATAGFPRHHLRPLLDHYQIPVKRTLRVGDVAGRSGVAREAIVAALSRAETTPPPEADSDLTESTVHVA